MISYTKSIYNHLKMFVDRRKIAKSGLFDEEWYRLAHPWIVREKIDALDHFIESGAKIGLPASRRFNTGDYLSLCEEARLSKLNPLVHYLTFGAARGLAAPPAAPSPADRIAASGFFDGGWYLAQNPDVERAGYDPLLHYLAFGAFEGRDPGPEFDCKWYLQQYPDIVGLDPLLHYLDHGKSEGRFPQPPSDILCLVQETIRNLSDLEPALAGRDSLEDVAGRLILNGRVHSRGARCFESIASILHSRPVALVLVPWISAGGADLVAFHAISALAEENEAQNVLVIVTDSDRVETCGLVADVPTISLSEVDEGLNLQERVDILERLVRLLRPQVTFLVNSHAGWELVEKSGRKLGEITRFYTALFCADFSERGQRIGYSDRYLRTCLPNLCGVYFDNQTYRDELSSHFSVPHELSCKFSVLYQPSKPDRQKRSNRLGGVRLNVLWASRICFQKNIDLLLDIVRSTPEFDFHIWGRGDDEIEEELRSVTRQQSNVFFCGAFERFASLPLNEYDAFLYTSRWDGLPNVLLEAAAAGMPIVSSAVGGISELISDKTGWLIKNVNDPGPYRTALHEIDNCPHEVEKRTNALKELLLERHSWQMYKSTLLATPPEVAGSYACTLPLLSK